MEETFSERTKELAVFAKAIGHPTRIKILKYLSKINSCYGGDFQEVLPYAPSTISQHLNELKKANLINGTVSYPKISYCINEENWEKAKALFKDFFDMQIDHHCF